MVQEVELATSVL